MNKYELDETVLNAILIYIKNSTSPLKSGDVVGLVDTLRSLPRLPQLDNKQIDTLETKETV